MQYIYLTKGSCSNIENILHIEKEKERWHLLKHEKKKAWAVNFTKRIFKMTNKHMKKCLPSLSYYPNTMVKINKIGNMKSNWTLTLYKALIILNLTLKYLHWRVLSPLTLTWLLTFSKISYLFLNKTKFFK